MNYTNKIINYVSYHENDKNILMKDIMCEILGLESILKHEAYESENEISVGYIVSTQLINNGTISEEIINNFIQDLCRCILNGEIVSEESRKCETYEHIVNMADWRTNGLASSIRTEISSHIPEEEWDLLCKHYYLKC